MRFAFYISGKSQRLYKFIKQAATETLETVYLVVSDQQIEPELHNICKKYSINVSVNIYKSIQGNDNKEKNLNLSKWMLEQFVNNKIDYCFSFGNHILAGELLERYENRLINFHPAILPMYPGLNAIDKAADEGRAFLIGNTAHFIDSGVDSGKIIMQTVMPINEFLRECDYDMILDLQIPMLNILIRVILENRLVVDDIGNVKISGADYSCHAIFPFFDMGGSEFLGEGDE